jgi:predicted enzyme related to lactoylglutathione lyase
MAVRWVTAFLDSPSRVAEPFWMAVTGWSLSARRGGGVFATLLPQTGDACLRVQVVGDGPARAHLDLHVEDVEDASRLAVAAGARVTFAEPGLVVLRSPAGIAFCLVAWDGEKERPGWRHSVVDQVCLDIPDGVYERESAFWVTMTGWALRASDLPEFSYLERPAGMAVRLLLQRIASGVAGVHLDLACDDVDAEVARHVGLGARVVRRVPGDWTTLVDPAGREYCVTGRSPNPS